MQKLLHSRVIEFTHKSRPRALTMTLRLGHVLLLACGQVRGYTQTASWRQSHERLFNYATGAGS